MGKSPHQVVAVAEHALLALTDAADAHHLASPRRALANRRQRHPERLGHFVARHDRDGRLRRSATNGRMMSGGKCGERGRMSSSVPRMRPCRSRSTPVSSHVSRIAVCSRSRSVGSMRPPGHATWPLHGSPLGFRAFDHQQLGLAGAGRAQHERDRRVARDGVRLELATRARREPTRETPRRQGARGARRAASRFIRRRRRLRPSREIRRPSRRRSRSPSASSSPPRTPSGCPTRSR